MTTNDATVAATRSRSWVGLSALTSTAHPGVVLDPRTDPRRVVVTEADGTHMGLALNWWTGALTGDEDLLRTIRQSISPADVLRSAVEVILAQTAQIAGSEEVTSAAVLREAATGSMILTESHRTLCLDLAAALDLDPDTTEIEMTALPVTHVMDFVVFLGRLIEYRGHADVATQINRYTRMVTTAERLR